MTVAQFQKIYGPKWVAIVNDPAFQAAMGLANLNTIQAIGLLSEKQIHEHGPEILAELKGRLAHENALVELAVPAQEEGQEPEAFYPDPEEDLRAEGNGEVVRHIPFSIPQHVPPSTSNPPPIDKAAQIKAKRQANAAKARAARQKKYQEKLKQRLTPK